MIQFTDVVKRIADHVHQPQGFVKGVLESFLTLIEKEDVAIRNFGVFRHRTTPEKLGRNPKTGTTVMIPARTVLKFRQAKRRVATHS